MSDTYVTLHGWVGGDVNFREPHGVSVASFRVASTPRLRKGGEWVDGDTTWYSVTVWRQLADNVRGSLRKGDAVIVHGRLRTDTWKREDGELNSSLQIEASLVGHDLSRGTSAFVRTQRSELTQSEVEREAEALSRATAQDLESATAGWATALAPPEQAHGDDDRGADSDAA